MGVMGVCVWWGLMGVLNVLDTGGGVARGAGKERGSGWDEDGTHTHDSTRRKQTHWRKPNDVDPYYLWEIECACGVGRS